MAEAPVNGAFQRLFRPRREKGIVLIIVLAMIFFIMLLANVILTIITSEFRLVQHSVARTQGYYAGMAGIHYAYNRLTVGDPGWPIPPAGNSYIRYLCDFSSSKCPGTIVHNDINETNLPESVDFVAIAVARKTAFASAPIVIGGTSTNIPGCSPCAHPNAGVRVCICARATYRN
jgi:hypothetical protein